MSPDTDALASVLWKLLDAEDVVVAVDRHGERYGYPAVLVLDDIRVDLTERQRLAVEEVLGA